MVKYHELTTVPIENGYRHTCLNCGAVKTSRADKPNWVGECRAPQRDVLNHPCKWLGAETGEDFVCRGCSKSSPRVHATFACSIHGDCLPLASVKGIHCCTTCNEYQAEITQDSTVSGEPPP